MPKSKLQKQKEAEDRAKIRAKRSPSDQIAHLDSIFGKGAGAAKERKRLLEATIQKVSKEEKTGKKRKKKDPPEEVHSS